jgi:AcrR family transcriptional regulator
LTPTALEAPRSNGQDARPRRSLYAKLKPGPGRSENEVLASQRSRLGRAIIELSAERGFEDVTVRGLTRLAGVSTRSFYKHYANVEECFAHSYESLMRMSLRRSQAARIGSAQPEGAIGPALESLFDDVACDPKAAWLVLVEAYAAGPSMQPRIEESVASFERLLGDSLAAGTGPSVPSDHVVAAIAAAVVRVARWRLYTGEAANLPALADELGAWVVSLLDRRASVETPDRDPLGLAAPSNGNHHREAAGPTALGEMGEDRGRILSATVKLAAVGGFSSLRVPRIRSEAGVSRRSFDARYTGVSECFLEAIEAVATSGAAAARSEARESATYERGVYRGIRALCSEAASNPALARLVFLDVLAPGRQGLGRRERLISLAAKGLRDGATACGHRPSELAAEASSAAAWRIAQVEIAAGRTKTLPRLLPLLAYVVLAPVIGPDAAAALIETEELRSIY